MMLLVIKESFHHHIPIFFFSSAVFSFIGVDINLTQTKIWAIQRPTLRNRKEVVQLLLLYIIYYSQFDHDACTPHQKSADKSGIYWLCLVYLCICMCLRKHQPSTVAHRHQQVLLMKKNQQLKNKVILVIMNIYALRIS